METEEKKTFGELDELECKMARKALVTSAMVQMENGIKLLEYSKDIYKDPLVEDAYDILCTRFKIFRNLALSRKRTALALLNLTSGIHDQADSIHSNDLYDDKEDEAILQE